jgi:hypothetical protein
VCSAARAHSRLHQAAVEVLRNIKASVDQQQLDSLVDGYLSAHGQQVNSLSVSRAVCADSVTLRQLPSALTQLSSLDLVALELQMQPRDRFPGVLGGAAALPVKQLRLLGCTLLDQEQGLAAALALLPGLEHVGIINVQSCSLHGPTTLVFPAGVLPVLQQLTSLYLLDCALPNPQDLGLLQGLTSLQHVQLMLSNEHSVPASMLTGSRQLTRLGLVGVVGECGQRPEFEPDVLTCQTHLQHFALVDYIIADWSAGVSQLLSHLQQLQQLTYLDLSRSLLYTAPADAYSALTASSKLQTLDLPECKLPANAWQSIFPPGRQLPHLRRLGIMKNRYSDGLATAPPGISLVSCCPGLQSLCMLGLQCSTEVMAALQGLSGLKGLSLTPAGPISGDGLQAVCQLTGLAHLLLDRCDTEDLLPLTQLHQLDALMWTGHLRGQHSHICLWGNVSLP